MIFNYIRVSTAIQNTERQLYNIPCDREYIDKASGKDTNRPELNALISNLREGDCINVHSMDRLARNVKDLLELVETILSKKASIKFHKENMEFTYSEKTSPFQKLMLSMLGAVSEFEREIILERQREGIALAKAKGKYKGGKKKLTNEQVAEIKKLISDGVRITHIARDYNITRQSVYNYI